MALIDTLITYGRAGVIALKESIASLRGTGNTEKSIRFEVTNEKGILHLTFYARQFFSTIETGRGPRKSNTPSGYQDEMYKYMIAKGIGSDLPEKKRKELARFLVWKINKEGDETFKKGGRVVYTPVVNRIKNEVKRAVAEEYIHAAITRIRHVTNSNKKTTASLNA
jgi:hypothetical protein